MQLIQLLIPLALVARCSAAEATAATTTAKPSLPTVNREDTLNATRQGSALNVLGIATSVVTDIVHEIFGIIKADDDKKAKWVDETLNRLWAADPGRNVLVYHSQKSRYRLQGTRHEHFELDKFLVGSYGYEIWVFESGSFTLEGGRDATEWGWRGCRDGQKSDLVGPHVEFCDPKKQEKQPPQQSSSKARTTTKKQQHTTATRPTTTPATTQHPKTTTIVRTVSQKPTTVVQTHEATAKAAPSGGGGDGSVGNTPDPLFTTAVSGGDGSGNSANNPAAGDGQGLGQQAGSSTKNSSSTGVPNASTQPATAVALVTALMALFVLVT
ncbi:uncharacterized protein PG986_008819 [Apiospora aurea]|uniref:Uncharacterized protein n=1 Tax=Apiospora aurea TaxID=335848 RepID=A0ABR1Q5Z3_9PEZI